MATIPVYKRQTTPNLQLNAVKNNASVSADSFGARAAELEGSVAANKIRLSGIASADAANQQIGALGRDFQRSTETLSTVKSGADTAAGVALTFIDAMERRKEEMRVLR